VAISTTLSPYPIIQEFDDNGNFLSGGKLFTYAAGTTTKQNTFTDSSGGTPNTNPVILDARGEANVWLSPTLLYKYVLSPSTDSDPPTNPIWTVDNIGGNGGGSIGSVIVSANFNAAAGFSYLATTSSGAITATLPSAPNTGDTIIIKDATGNAAANPITLALNGNSFEGSSVNPTINVGFGWLKIQWTGTQWVQMP
jgi:hypothetical protein